MPGGIYDSYDRLVKASSFTRQLRMQEVPSQAGNTTGRIVFDWQSPDNAYFIPASSYVLMTFDIEKTGGAAIAVSDAVDLVENPGAAAVSSCQHFINGVSVGLQSQNPVAKQMLTKAFMQRDVKESIGDVFNVTATRTHASAGQQLITVFQPALGFYNLDTGIAGRCRHQLELHMQSNLIPYSRSSFSLIAKSPIIFFGFSLRDIKSRQSPAPMSGNYKCRRHGKTLIY